MNCDQLPEVEAKSLKVDINNQAIAHDVKPEEIVSSLDLALVSENHIFKIPLEYKTGLHESTILNSVPQHIEKMFVYRVPLIVIKTFIWHQSQLIRIDEMLKMTDGLCSKEN